jgi:hypothetical protein
MVAQRVFGIALGYEDLIDHDHLRHDPVLATLAGKLEARRQNCAALAGKSTLNRATPPSDRPGIPPLPAPRAATARPESTPTSTLAPQQLDRATPIRSDRPTARHPYPL